MKNKFSGKLPRPKITLDRVGQIVFTLKEITKLAFKIKPRLLVTVFILNAIWGFSAVPGFYLEKLILDRLVGSIGVSDYRPVLLSISWIILASLTLSLFRNLLSSYNRFLRRTLSRYFDTELSILLGKKLSELDLYTIESPEFRDKFDKIEKESSRRAWQLIMPLSDIPNYLVGFISAVAVLVFLHPLVTLAVVIASLPQLFINSKFIKKQYRLVTELSTKRRIWSWLSYYLIRNKNYMELKLLNLPDYLSKKLRKVAGEVLDKRTELAKKRELSRFGSLIPLTLLELGVSLWLVVLVIVEKITVGSFQMYLRSLKSAQQNLRGLVSALLEIYENYIYVTDLVWFLDLESSIESSSEGKILKAGSRYPIEFENVRFKYRKGTPWIIKGIDFKITPGEKIALVGENGAGKSTLIKLMARFYDPQKGTIRVGGNNLKDLDVKNWREKLAVLFQIFELYPFTAREAIGYGDVKRLDELDKIKKVAKRTGIDKFIEGLPKKYENPITPEFKGGVMPSIGQWQRFGISRMLFRENAEVIILDEPTSNIDPEAEEKIFRELKRITRDKILLFVTQRFSTVKIADRIFVMHQGRIIEKGTHKELMKKDGKYARMFKIQAEAYLKS